MTITPGVHDLTAEAYHADPCPEPSLSSSGARLIMRECPAIYWHDRQQGGRRSPAFGFGSAAHEWLLEGDRWPQRHHVLPPHHNGRTNGGKAEKAEAEAAGLRVITSDEFEQVMAMKSALEGHPFAMAAFQGGDPEKSLIWRDDEFGIWCRARPDYIPKRGGIIADYKTCRSANPADLQRDIANFGYHQQAAWYCGGLRSLGVVEEPTFLFVFQAKTAPYLVTCVTLQDAAVQWGETLNRKARQTFAECLRAGRWPGYVEDIIGLTLPAWEDKKLQQRFDRGDFAIDWQAPIRGGDAT